MHEDLLAQLEQRLGPVHAKQRLGIETDHEAQAFGQGLTFFHIENWYSVHSLIRIALMLVGLYGRGKRNAERVVLRHNDIWFKELPPLFDGFTILHISDLHADINETAMRNLVTGKVDSGFLGSTAEAAPHLGQHFPIGPLQSFVASVEAIRSQL